MKSVLRVLRGGRAPLAAALLLPLAVCVLPLAGCGAPATEMVAVSSAPQEIPVETYRGYFFLPVDFGGEADRRMWFLFDTGANVTVVDPDALAAVSDFAGGGGKRVNLIDVRSGPLTWKRLPVRTQDLDHLSRTLGRQIDGILGFPAMQPVLLTLDYGAGTMQVATGDLPRPDGDTVYPLRNTSNRRPWVELQGPGLERLVLLDSGASGGFSLQRYPQEAWAVPPVAVGTSMGIRDLETRRIGRSAEPLRILGQDYDSPQLRLSDGTELVGIRVLKHFRLTFDQRRQRVQVERLAPGPVPPEALRGTGLLTEALDAGLLVHGLTPGSPAEAAGLRPGDRILSVSGTPHDARPEDGFRPLREGEREFHRYRVRRGEQEWEVDVDLADLVPAPAESGA